MRRYIEEQLIKWRDSEQRKPLILKGARQVGKTFVLKKFGESSFPAFHYINFEKNKTVHRVFEGDLEPEKIIEGLSYHLGGPIHVGKDLVIFDEIQHCPNALTSLKYFNEDLPHLHICAAGSLLGLYLPETSFPVGKVTLLSMFPMSFEEFLIGIGEERLVQTIVQSMETKNVPLIAHELLWEKLKLYFVIGGLPEVIETFRLSKEKPYQALQEVRVKQKELVEFYFADIAKHSGKENAMRITQVLQNIPEQLAREQSGSVSKYRVSQAVPGISKYSRLVSSIDWLLTAGLVVKVPIANSAKLPLSAFCKYNNFKLFLFDIGVLGALTDLDPKSILGYDYGTYKGYFAENYVAQEFLASGVHNLFGWRENTAELEFVRDIGGVIIPVEVKSGNVTQAKSLRMFFEKYRPPCKVILSAKPIKIDDVNALHQYPLYLAFRFSYLCRSKEQFFNQNKNDD